VSDLLTLKKRLQNIHAVHEITDAMHIISTIAIGNAQKFLDYRRKVQSLHDRLFITSNACIRQSKENENWLIIFFSEKGFCGNFNPQLLPLLNKNKNIENIIVIGTRGRTYAERLGIKTEYFFEAAKRQPKETIIDKVYDLLKEKGFPQNIKVIFNKYNNVFIQTPKIINFFPDFQNVYKDMNSITDIEGDYLDKFILERYVQAKLIYFFAQNYTWEIASKLLMMKNATDSAKKLHTDLSKQVYKARQMKITQELSEVISAYKVLQLQRERR